MYLIILVFIQPLHSLWNWKDCLLSYFDLYPIFDLPTDLAFFDVVIDVVLGIDVPMFTKYIMNNKFS